MLLLVQVNNANGEHWTKILSRETAPQAKHRIQFHFRELWRTRNGLALRDDDLITKEEAPYVFKEALQQQQNGKLSLIVLLFSTCCWNTENCFCIAIYSRSF